MQRLKKIGLRLFGLVLVLVGGWSLYHKAATVKSADTYPAPGQMVDAGGRGLHMLCRGAGDGPAVVLVSGLGAIPYYAWPDIAVPLSGQTRTCLYDRAGYGWSDPHEGPLDLDAAVADLKRITEAAGEGRPVILVGHSYGGLLVRQLALRAPDKVAGLVLLDSSHEQSFSRWPKDGDYPSPKPDWQAWLTPGLGYYRLAATFWATKEGVEYLSDEDFDRLIELYTHTDYHLAVNAEHRDVLAKDHPKVPAGALGDMPLVVLSRDTNIIHSFPPRAREELVWAEMQQELAQISTNSRFEILEGASHNFTLDRPEAIIGAVKELIAQAEKLP